MYPLGSKERPIIVKVSSKEKANKVAAICDAHNFYYIVGLEFNEDVSDLKKALKDCKRPENIYENCSCNSGKKYKFCCMNKEIELNI
ncbi:DNA-binding protein [Bacillus thuringiensis]|uniref:DNA-binding protein n=1 Tax=Bacillus thuringiensis subsp. higo TaxID=132266 RepID=A0A9X6LJK2_BACUH|nr:DNA-binding protein [Bacillus thuringiensis]OUB41948.1 DNA-binding protein [Bacillus thuringiensis serovar higo]OUB48488.1 DNA-binding protein [Bacillus thuringiensis serovar higo]OUB50561.1 DNA-binding protein [Bacillus thuringiensis serovar higo]OUB59077.1 DNA-binding protein [Bacillus thuringiensis serovar higo]OUB61253.1 DNA-binding protein [Bacillus thuringiensis serovar higo]